MHEATLDPSNPSRACQKDRATTREGSIASFIEALFGDQHCLRESFTQLFLKTGPPTIASFNR
jgi:hypothetical protein